MGNCPSANAIPGPAPATCVLKCPAQFRYDLTRGCVSIVDPSVSFLLEPISWIPWADGKPPNPQIQSIDQLQTVNPSLYGQYTQAVAKFNQDAGVAQGRIDRSAQTRTLFDRLQAAENVSDQFPDAYQQARMDYYSLIKGPKWAEGEKSRIGNTEARNKTEKYSQEYQTLRGQLNQQQTLIDLLNSSKDKVLGVADDVQYSVTTLNKQVEDVRNQIAMNTIQHSSLKTKQSWFIFALNALIVILIVYASFLLIYRFVGGRKETVQVTSFYNGSPGRPYYT